MSDVNVEFANVHADGDTVIIEMRTRAKLANARNYDVDYCFVFTVRDGRVSRIREYMDTLNGFRQIFGENAVEAVSAVVEPIYRLSELRRD